MATFALVLIWAAALIGTLFSCLGIWVYCEDHFDDMVRRKQRMQIANGQPVNVASGYRVIAWVIVATLAWCLLYEHYILGNPIL